MDIRKKISIFIFVFYAVALLQMFGGRREDWPFSFFGMYKGKISPHNVVRLDIDLIRPDSNQPQSLFPFLSNSFYLTEKLLTPISGFHMLKDRTVKSHHGEIQDGDRVLIEVDKILGRDIIPQLRSQTDVWDPQNEIRISVKQWTPFKWQSRFDPNAQKVVYQAPFSRWILP
jgi:hypothetical protein